MNHQTSYPGTGGSSTGTGGLNQGHVSSAQNAPAIQVGQNRDMNGDGLSSNAAYSLPTMKLPSGGGTIRSMNEAFSTDLASGSASMSIPIPTTKTARWGTPDLSLQYESGGGNGVFGLGWQLSGLPCIRRKTNNGLPTYVGDEDTFVLGDDDLIPVFEKNGDSWVKNFDGTFVLAERRTPDGFIVRRYRRRVDKIFDRIERWSEAKNPREVYWKVIDSKNTTQVFGRTKSSQISSGDRIYSWHICEAYDAYGGAQLIEYKDEDGVNIDQSAPHEQNRTQESRSVNKYVKRVLYGNQEPNRRLEDWNEVIWPSELPREGWIFELVLDYGEHDKVNPDPAAHATMAWPVRADPFSTYLPGFEVRTYRLCRRILMFHHLSKELYDKPSCLVSSLELSYREPGDQQDSSLGGTTITFLKNAQLIGYKATSTNTYAVKKLPPLEFRYTEPSGGEKLKKLTLQTLDDESMMNIPAGVSGKLRWLDLSGDGTTGILSQDAGSWFYKRNFSRVESEPPGLSSDLGSANDIHVELGPMEVVFEAPNLGSDQDSGISMSFTDVNGDGLTDLMIVGDSLRGCYLRDRPGIGASMTWAPFKPFQSWPNVNLNDPNLRMIDLTGDGKADILITHDDKLLWYPSLGVGGFGPSQEVALALDEASGPRILFSDSTQSIYLTDMSGDGLVDIARIMNGQICYWPNMGRGRFGSKVEMDNAPVFDSDDGFSQSNILLADVDGSGTTDIFYLGVDGVTKLFYNQSGNGWSPPLLLSALIPRYDSETEVASIDLLGTGTTCLVWSSRSIALDGSISRSLQYVDLMDGIKPHLLSTWKNNRGLETTLTYRSSTAYYIKDMKEGRQWATTLPFPVHCVDSVQKYDEVSKNLTISRYRYHHGYYDGIEREFCGFGMTEKWDTEDFNFFKKVGDLANLSNHHPATYVAPVHSKNWFHIGTYNDTETLRSVYRQEFFGGSMIQDQSTAQAMNTLSRDKWEDKSGLGLTSEECQQAAQALKGMVMHEEIYGDALNSTTSPPYVMNSTGNTSRMIQPQGQNKWAVFQSFQHERQNIRCEGNIEDCAVVQHLNLMIDDFGNCLKSVDISYGRDEKALQQDLVLDDDDKNQQRKRHIIYKETAYTNLINDDTDYRCPLPSMAESYEIANFRPDLVRLSSDHFAKADGSLIEDFEPIVSMKSIEYYADVPSDVASKRLVSAQKIKYRQDDMGDLLKLHELEPLALPGQTYDLAMTKSMLSIYKKGDQDYQPDADSLKAAGYTDFDTNESWWIPSSLAYYNLQGSDEIKEARQSFFMPKRCTNPFQATSTVQYDTYNLLPIFSTDAVGNTMTANNDYVMLGPASVIDTNDNKSGVARDALGMVVGMAIMGKGGPNTDSFDTFDADISSDDINAYIADPRKESSRLLGSASSRFIYQFYTSDTPDFVSTIRAETFGQSEARKVQIAISYQNGAGQAIQQKLQADDLQWCTTGYTVYNNKGLAVQRFDNFFDPTPAFTADSGKGACTTAFYDAVNRPIAYLYADKTWEKEEIATWSITSHDRNDTVNLNPSEDQDIGSSVKALGSDAYEPTWFDARINDKLHPFEQSAAMKAQAYKDTPQLLYIDSTGNKFLHVRNTGNELIKERYLIDIQGRLIITVDGRGRIATRSSYDMTGRCIFMENLDSGPRWTLFDVLSKPMDNYDGLGRHLVYMYDSLRRPIRTMVAGTGSSTFVSQTSYGDQKDDQDTKSANLRGQIYQIWDQAGLKTIGSYDLQGNAILSERQLAANYKTMLDWSHEVSLEAEVYTTSKVFDALGRPISAQSPDGSATTYAYGDNGNLASIVSNVDSNGTGTYVGSIEYNAQNQDTLWKLGNGIIVQKEYDDQTHRLTRKIVSTTSQRLQDVLYHYDAVGNVVFLEDAATSDVFFRNARVTANAEYTYDAAYRLIVASGREHLGQTNGQPFNSTIPAGSAGLGNNLAPGDGSAVTQYTETYTYDSAGNMLSLQHGFVDKQTPGWTRQFDYSNPNPIPNGIASNRLSSTMVGSRTENYTYDEIGNCTSMPGVLHATWDISNQLQSTTTQATNSGTPETTWYVYDSSGTRIRKVVESQAGPDETPRRLSDMISIDDTEHYRKYNGQSEIDLECHTLHLKAGGNRVALVERWSGKSQESKGLPTFLTRYQHSIKSGSANIELDESAQILSYEEYTPYGSTTYSSALKKAPKRYRYAGKERDHETGFYYFGARYYLPWLCRWMNPDPLGITDGLNVYLYVACNPVGYQDPTGTMMEEDDDGGGGGGNAQGGARAAPPSPLLPQVRSSSPEPQSPNSQRDLPWSEPEEQLLEERPPEEQLLEEQPPEEQPLEEQPPGQQQQQQQPPQLRRLTNMADYWPYTYLSFWQGQRDCNQSAWCPNTLASLAHQSVLATMTPERRQNTVFYDLSVGNDFLNTTVFNAGNRLVHVGMAMDPLLNTIASPFYGLNRGQYPERPAWFVMSAVFANSAVGNAIFIMPRFGADGVTPFKPHAEGIWELVELPALKRNNVQVWVVHPEDFEGGVIRAYHPMDRNADYSTRYNLNERYVPQQQ